MWWQSHECAKPNLGLLLSTSLPQGKFIVIWSLRIYLNFFSFYTKCYREWILNTFTYCWCFLELVIEKFIPNINNEHAQDYSCPGATFGLCSHGEKLPRQGGLPGVVQRVTRLLKLPGGNEKLMWTVTVVRPCTEVKLTPGVSELDPGNELSRDQVNRSLFNFWMVHGHYDVSCHKWFT